MNTVRQNRLHPLIHFRTTQRDLSVNERSVSAAVILGRAPVAIPHGVVGDPPNPTPHPDYLLAASVAMGTFNLRHVHFIIEPSQNQSSV